MFFYYAQIKIDFKRKKPNRKALPLFHYLCRMNFVKTRIQNRIGEIYLDRPEKRNALNAQFVQELMDAFTSLEKDANCKVIILKSSGNVFCAGADLEYLQQLQSFTFEENLEDSSHLMSLFKKIYTSPKIIIAQIEGHAIAVVVA